MEGDMDRADVVERLYGAVEALVLSSPAGLRCEYEYLPTDRSELPCVSMQVLDGDPIERRYLDGGTVWRLPVALVLRQATPPSGSTRRRSCDRSAPPCDPSRIRPQGTRSTSGRERACARSRPGRCPRECRRRPEPPTTG